MQHALANHYTMYLVMLAFVIIWLASYTCLSLSHRIAISKGWQQKLWIACSAMTIGSGAWSMHFIAMLAQYHPDRLVYNVQTILASLAVVAAGSLIGFFIAFLTGPGVPSILIGGVFMGLSVSSMHYIGLSAINAVEVRFSPVLFILSVLLAVAASIAVLKMSVARSPKILIRGFLISVTITGMHYLGTLSASAALPLNHTEYGENASQLNAFVLAMLIAFGTIIFLSLIIIYSLRIDQRLADHSSLKALLLDTSIDSILMINSRGWIIEFNPAAAATFGYSRKQALSMTMLDFLYPFDQNGEAAASLYRQLARQDAALLGKRVHMKAYRSDRSAFPAEVTITKIPYAGNMIFAATVRDLTEGKHEFAAIS
ncbi:MHYT domain-containing protein [Paenibacillus sp. GCM10023248]|uniref:MHYT domain-containing protein n=1 Tax=unclassified Paenibacillus TaxID=185978 RepID=UPI002377E175|nr:MHYT domain-containing protein [Paenibacillus sp. MAHUQ-63]MDD9267461.1 MHYT domain-containing protein [Paenibacillus sp. MAHUQ-63]